MSRFTKKGRPPIGYEYIQGMMDGMESELREKMNEPTAMSRRKSESLWPVHQINWQRSRYVYDLYYKYHKIERNVYDYCIKHKLIDANLIAKWKKPGYERLCSTYAINTKNFNFGTVSICRVPKHQLEKDTEVQSKHAGCRGCASGSGGEYNIFGNKYGQFLAAIQIAREARDGNDATNSRVWVMGDADDVQANVGIEEPKENDEGEKETPPPSPRANKRQKTVVECPATPPPEEATADE